MNIRGNPTPEELAAVIAVVSSRAAGGAVAGQRGPVSVWADRSRNMRRMPHPGPGAWRASAWRT